MPVGEQTKTEALSRFRVIEERVPPHLSRDCRRDFEGHRLETIASPAFIRTSRPAIGKPAALSVSRLAFAPLSGSGRTKTRPESRSRRNPAVSRSSSRRSRAWESS